MDDLAFGRLVRLSRIRRDWTQADLGRRAGLSPSEVSRIECGQLGAVQLRTLRAVCAPLELRIDLLARGRRGDVDRLLDANHAAMAVAAVAWLGTFGGWEVRPEVSYAVFGERGVVDLVGWNAGARAVLLVELKTELTDLGSMLGTLDRRHRLAGRIVEGLGWRQELVGTLLLVASSDANRSRVRAHAGLFDAALPARIGRVRGWLRAPAGELRGLAFLANSRPGHANHSFAPRQRVRRRPGPANRGHLPPRGS
jgi:transcriptional regulator with XRE-family HTH domain